MDPDELRRCEAALSPYGERFETKVDEYLPLLELRRTKAGTIAVRQPFIHKRSKAWWQAQCSFRGLKATGKVDELQQRIRSRDTAQDVPIGKAQRDMQHRVDAEHARIAKAKEDDIWKTISNEQKAEMNAERLLREALLSEDGPQRTPMVLKIESRSTIHSACEKLSLEHVSIDAPPSFSKNSHRPLRWIVVGTDRTRVNHEVNAISHQAARERKEAKAAEEAQIQRKRAATLHAAQAKGSERGQWDITGEWEIACEALAEYSEGPASSLSLEIFMDRDKGHHKYCAEFDFGIIEGVMRINALGKTKHNAGRQTQYVWRGRETGEGEIQLGSDEASQSITFHGYGTSLKGSFKCDYLELVEFSGLKISESGGHSKSGAMAWDELDEDAHERARANRWRWFSTDYVAPLPFHNFRRGWICESYLRKEAQPHGSQSTHCCMRLSNNTPLLSTQLVESFHQRAQASAIEALSSSRIQHSPPCFLQLLHCFSQPWMRFKMHTSPLNFDVASFQAQARPKQNPRFTTHEFDLAMSIQSDPAQVTNVRVSNRS
ncbi:hypothetical protein LTR37_003605 [Vermiconidia calcicola]|uniref:Uncharacterized protein n=1 Tax=Vermiconidia calcicola TaxID=1690605 RepID=A0ACC3NPQ4_9PEZI|nr:hypothetical protein LTR37_003605 [Vermiconidia calcicola]